MNRFVRILFIVVLILMVPLVAMQITEEVQWGVGDFFVAGCLLFLTGVGIDFIFKSVEGKRRWIYILYVVFIMLLVWMEMAVGIFD